MDALFLTGIVFAPVGLFFVVAGLVIYCYDAGKKKRCISLTYGEVIDIDSRVTKDNDGVYSTVYSPYVRYYNNLGVEFVTKNIFYSSPNRYSVGQQVKVYFNPDKPEEMFVEGDKSASILYFIFGGLGLIFLILGIVFVAMSRVSDRTGDRVTGVTIEGTTEMSGGTTEPEQTMYRVSDDIIENMAEATPVDGITITDEMLEKGILNEGNKARLFSVMARASRGEEITIAYIGGSITAGSTASSSSKCFAALSTDWWENTFPDAKINYVNAGIGGTDSWLGVHRVREDVLSENPDLVIAEFAVNDGQGWNQETYDSLMRTLLEGDSRPAVIALMIAHKYGSFADKHAPVAFKYQVPIISYSALLTQGLVPWNKVGNSDGTHPDDPGHQLIAHLLTEYYRRTLSEINSSEPVEYEVPSLSGSLTQCRYINSEILYSDQLEASANEDFEPAEVTGILSKRDGWRTESAGSISFTLDTREVGIIWLQKNQNPGDTYVSQYELYIDGELQGTLPGVADSWGNHLEYKSVLLGDEAVEHLVELKPAGNHTGAEFEILGIGVAR